MSISKKSFFLTQFSMLLAIEAVLSFTPLGSLPAIGPIVMTLGMIPVVLAGILLGVGAGAALGAFAGLFSLCVWTYMPPSPPMAFVFTPFYSFGEVHGNFFSLVICFVPRILTGVVAALCYRAAEKRLRDNGKSETHAYIFGAALGSLTNTFGVLGGIFIFFGGVYAGLFGLTYELVLAALGMQVLTSGVPEAILSAIVAAGACGPIKKMIARMS